jgi:hypothetical protein
MAGRRRAWELVGLGNAPADQAKVASRRGLGPPQSASVGQKASCTKSLAQLLIFQKNCCNGLNLVKCIEKYLLVRKMRMTYQNAQKNMLYMFMSNSCIFRLL